MTIIKYTLFSLIFAFCANFSHAEQIDIERLLDAIYIAEGGQKASVPYGLIYSSWCTDEPGWCRYYAREIVLTHLKRCKEYEDEVSCIGRQYAPITHSELNKNWVPNVKKLYQNK